MLEAVAQCTPPPPPPAAAAGDASCTATAGGLGPAVPWAAATDGSELSVCLGGNFAAAVGTSPHSGCSPTITIANAGNLRIECGKSTVGGLCTMMDRLDVAAAATLFLLRLVFEGLSAATSFGGAIYIHSTTNGGHSTTGAAVTVVECAFRDNSVGSGYVRSPPSPWADECVWGLPLHPSPLNRFVLDAFQVGGAIFANPPTVLSVTDTSFAANTAGSVRASPLTHPSLSVPPPGALYPASATSGRLRGARLQ